MDELTQAGGVHPEARKEGEHQSFGLCTTSLNRGRCQEPNDQNNVPECFLANTLVVIPKV